MNAVRWEFYPLVAQTTTARTWLELQQRLQLAPKTIDAYGRSLNDFLAFCEERQICPEDVTREQVTLYVQDLATRPHPKQKQSLTSDSERGLSNSTMQQRLTVLRLYCDHLMERNLRSENPVGRGYYVPGKAFGGIRQRGLLHRYRKLPWIPDDEEWQRLLVTLKAESLRNQLMLLLAYDGALRREELVTLEVGDLDVAYRQIHVQAEHAKNRSARVVSYSATTSRFLERYLQRRRDLSAAPGALFLSESHRNFGQPLSLIMWSKIVEQLAARCQLPRFTTHTPRHLRLTHLARGHLELHQIASYAGHRSLETTMQYIHLSGVELSEAVNKNLTGFEQWIARVLDGARP